MSKGTSTILLVIGCILLAIANVALWAALHLFNPDRFGERVAEGLQSDASSQALAGAVVDKIVDVYPEFPPLAQIPAEEIVAWTLQRPLFTPIFKETAAVASVVMTTSAQDVIGIDLSDLGDKVVGVVNAIDPEAGANVETAFESIQESGPLVIYESGMFPKLRTLSNTVSWLWPLAGLAAAALLSYAYSQAKDQKSSLKSIGAGVLITGTISLLLIPALQAPVLNSITDIVIRTVVGEVLTALTRGLVFQCLLLVVFGVILIVVGNSPHKSGKKA